MIKSKRVKVPLVFQIEACECGAACLAMVMGYYGNHTGLDEIRNVCGVSRDGCNASSIVIAAENYGLAAKGYRKKIEKLADIKFPCIIHWNFSHFVVLEGIKGKKYYIADPANGKKILNEQEFSDGYTGIVLTFEKTDRFVRKKKESIIPNILRSRISEDKSAVIFMVLSGLLLILPGLFIPMITENYIEDVLLMTGSSKLDKLLVALIVMNIYRLIFRFEKSMVLAKLKMKISLLTNFKLSSRLMRLPLRFYEQRYPGELSGRIENNDSINDFITKNYADTVINLFTAVFYLFLMLLYSLPLTVISLIGLLLNILISGKMLDPIRVRTLKMLQDNARTTAVMTSGFSIASSIKANGIEDEYTSGIINTYAKMTASEQKLARVQQLVSVIPSIITELVSNLVLLVGGYLIIMDMFDTGEPTAFAMLLASFYEPTTSIITMARGIQDTKASLQRVEDIEQTNIDARFVDEDKQDPQEGLEGSVEVRDLFFGYNRSLPPTVQGISFTASPGSRIAIVGSSGCGKSTLAKLVSGMETPWSGEILYDSIPVSKLSKSYLADNICVVNQDTAIFSGTIRDNITMWKKDFSQIDLTHAVRDADAEDLINRLPNGYDHYLDENGANFSGGQRQKIGIARALLKNPSVLILDESTSALDAVSEQRIMDNIRCRNCTCIIVAHRLSTVRNCDLIIVMQNGMPVQYGTHDSLMKVDGLYKTLVGC